MSLFLPSFGDSSDKAAPVSGEHAKEAGAALLDNPGEVIFGGPQPSASAARRYLITTCPWKFIMRPASNQQSTVVRLDLTGTPPPLVEPSSLTAAERALFKEIVSATDRRHFAEGDVQLLVSYVQVTLAVRKLAAVANRKPSPGAFVSMERMTRLQASLATKLRLSPQSRLDRKTAGRLVARQEKASYYDRAADDDDE